MLLGLYVHIPVPNQLLTIVDFDFMTVTVAVLVVVAALIYFSLSNGAIGDRLRGAIGDRLRGAISGRLRGTINTRLRLGCWQDIVEEIDPADIRVLENLRGERSIW